MRTDDNRTTMATATRMLRGGTSMARRLMPENDLKVILDKLEYGMFGQPSCASRPDKAAPVSQKGPPKTCKSIANREIQRKTGLGLLGALMARKPIIVDDAKAAEKLRMGATDALMQRVFELNSKQDGLKQDVAALEAQNKALRMQLAEQDELLQRQQLLVEQANEKLKELQFYKMQAMLAEGRADIFLDARAALERKHKKELAASRRSSRIAVTRVLELEKELEDLKQQKQQQQDLYLDQTTDKEGSVSDEDQASCAEADAAVLPPAAITNTLRRTKEACSNA